MNPLEALPTANQLLAAVLRVASCVAAVLAAFRAAASLAWRT
jgi:hypothetical protein